ncbi:hypothetical protein YYC_02180 [Plasmodium yoelii 17X]|uniref:Early transcribed membrane protein n=1 Tax=Plasmodium yoelii 17X TaxID=1323249 RepID=V7PMK2_PLAYE|nr:hypothetical protein YYC_02180 [Plasmodium yoelii 17X]
MKLAKALYFVAFLLAIKVLTPGYNNCVEAKPANSKKVTKSGNNAFIKKIKNNKVAFISTLAGTIALVIGTTLGVMHFQKKESDDNSSPDSKTPLIVARKNTNLVSDNKNILSTTETNKKSSTIETNKNTSTIETNKNTSTIETNKNKPSTIETNTKSSSSDINTNPYRYNLRYL